jgi:hypothetical protein
MKKNRKNAKTLKKLALKKKHVPPSCDDWFDCAWLDEKATPKRVIDNKNKNKNKLARKPSKKPTKNHFVFLKKNKSKPTKKTHATNKYDFKNAYVNHFKATKRIDSLRFSKPIPPKATTDPRTRMDNRNKYNTLLNIYGKVPHNKEYAYKLYKQTMKRKARFNPDGHQAFMADSNEPPTGTSTCQAVQNVFRGAFTPVRQLLERTATNITPQFDPTLPPLIPMDAPKNEPPTRPSPIMEASTEEDEVSVAVS